MPRKLSIALVVVTAALGLSACNNQQQAPTNQTEIKVRGPEQDRLKHLDAFNLAVGLKRAIYDAGYTCKRITDAGFVGTYKNLDMWMARCTYDQGPGRDWAIFAGPDGSAQVRDCRDVKAGNANLPPSEALPDCVIKQRPKGSFNDVK